MRGPSSLRGAMDASADGSTLRLTSGSQESRVMGLSSTEARIIYWRNMIVLMLSLIVGTKTICAILRWVNALRSFHRNRTKSLIALPRTDLIKTQRLAAHALQPRAQVHQHAHGHSARS